MKRRQLILLLGGASSGAMSAGTGAFSSVEAEREVSVNVVEDDEAYLSLKKTAHEIPPNTDEKVVEIRNQFADDLNLAVSVEEQGDGIDNIDIPSNGDITRLSPGDSVFVSVTCTEDTDFKLSFDGDAGGASVEKMKRFEVECSNQIESVTFPGKNAKIEGKFADLEVIVKFEEKDEETRTISSQPSGNYVVKGKGNKIISVEIAGTTYRRE